MSGARWEAEITRAARNVTRLQSVRRQLRKRLKDTERELREQKRTLRKLVGTLAADQQLAPRHTQPGLGMPTKERGR